MFQPPPPLPPSTGLRRLKVGGIGLLVVVLWGAAVPSFLPGAAGAGPGLLAGAGQPSDAEWARLRHEAWLRGREAAADAERDREAARQAAAGAGATAGAGVVPVGGDRTIPALALRAYREAAAYLCLSVDGSLSDPAVLRQAVYNYNHSWPYVAAILGWARLYAGGVTVGAGAPSGTAAGPGTSGTTGSAATTATTQAPTTSRRTTTTERSTTTSPSSTTEPATTGSSTTTTAPCQTTTTSTSTSSSSSSTTTTSTTTTIPGSSTTTTTTLPPCE